MAGTLPEERKTEPTLDSHPPSVVSVRAGASAQGAERPPAGGFEHLTWGTFLTANLIPVTLGTIIGGGLMIGLFYWLVFRPKRDAGR